MSGYGRIKWMVVASMTCTWAWGMLGCASGKSSARQQEAEQEVMYSPPAEETVTSVPAGAPLAKEYEAQHKASSKQAPLKTTSQPGSGQVTRADLAQLLEQGPGWGLVHVKVRPVKSEGGNLLGYEVYELTQAANLWLAPAIVPGDRITHLNGVHIKTPDDYMEAWNLARDVSELRIDYVRDGEANYSSWSVVE